MSVKSICNGGNAGIRVNQLQFLRFVAFMNIFLWHADQWNFIHYPTWNGSLLSVSFFFMLSGLITGYTGYGRSQKPCVKDIALYIWNKIKKLYPLCFLIQVIWLLSSGIMTSLVHYNFAEVAQYFRNWVKHILLIQSWFPTGYFNFANVCWFFSTLMFLYLFNLPIVYLLNKVSSHPKCGRMLSGMLILTIVATVAYHYFAQFYSDIHFAQYVFPPARVGEYLAGMILGFSIRQHKLRVESRKVNGLVYTGLEVFSLVCWFAVLFIPGDNWAGRVVYWLFPNMFLLSVFTLGYGKVAALFCWKPLVWLGDITVECVLLHQTVIALYSCFSGIWSGDTRLVCAVSLAYCMFLTLLVAMIVHGKMRK